MANVAGGKIAGDCQVLRGKTHTALKGLVAGIALYGLILHSSLSAIHFYANLNPASSSSVLHSFSEICFGRGTALADENPDEKKSWDYSCPLCVRLAGLHLGPLPAAIVLPLTVTKSAEIVGVSLQVVAAHHYLRPHTRGPPSLS
jgi:hypothetical protein